MSIRTADIRLVSSHPEVYEPCEDSFALLDALLADRNNLIDHRPNLCLELGSGSGYVITSLALMLADEAPDVCFFATDVNPDAVGATQETLRAHGVEAEVILTDMASGLEQRMKDMVDVMVVNPPYVPTPEDEVGGEGIVSAWAGGEKGRRVIDRVLVAAEGLLSERGWLYMVTLSANEPLQICVHMKERGYCAKIILQKSTEEENLQSFGPHIDESVDLGSGKKTCYTLLVYLSGAPNPNAKHSSISQEESSSSGLLLGGETVFYSGRNKVVAKVSPVVGMALLHIHGNKCLLHEALNVTKGVKYVLRSDVVFS